jgi:putative ABC transport system permease protein
MENLLQDFRQALRSLVKAPGFSIAAIVTLALGVGATAVLYSILDGAYIHFGPTEQTNRAEILSQQFRTLKSETWSFSAPEYFDLVRGQKSFDGLFANIYFSPTLEEATAQAGNPERVPVVRATANIFEAYGVSPIFGRVFTAEEDRPGGENVAVMTYRLWTRRFRQNPGIIGSTIRLDGVPYTIVGITPRRFQMWGGDIFIPLHLDPAATDRSERTLRVAGIPKKGISQNQIDEDLQVVARQAEAEYKGSNPEYKGLRYVGLNIRSLVIGDLRKALYILLAAAGLLLLIAAANIANLLLARVLWKQGEVGIRLALGATWFRVTRQFVLESIALGVVAGGLGCALGLAALQPTLSLVPDYFIGEEAEVHASPTAFLIAMVGALLLSVAFGMMPALLVARRGSAENLLHRRTRSVSDRRGGRARLLLVYAEMALAFVVVAGAGLMVRSYRQLTLLDFGFRQDHVLTMRLELPQSKYSGAAQITGFFQDLSTRVRALPGVADVAIASSPPLGRRATRDFEIPGRSLTSASGLANAYYRIVSADYFSTVGTPLRSGRFFQDNDRQNSAGVAIVNQSFARKWFANDDAVGKQIELHNVYGRDVSDISSEPTSDVLQIVGVVGNSKHVDWGHLDDLNQAPDPEIYVPFQQHANRDMALLLRSTADPGALTQSVRGQVLSMDSSQAIYDVQTLQEATTGALGPARLALALLSGFGSLSLLIASVGLYALVAYSVAQRTQEIGIRMALGARREEILRMVVRQALTWAGSGLVLGLCVSVGLTRLMAGLLYGVRPNDAGTFLGVSAVLLGVALLASAVPAVRAMKVDPMVALRYE